MNEKKAEGKVKKIVADRKLDKLIERSTHIGTLIKNTEISLEILEMAAERCDQLIAEAMERKKKEEEDGK